MSLAGANERIVFSNGMGVESVAVLLRWILEPESRNFPLSSLTVVTAMLGDEWNDTVEDFSSQILPLFRKHGIRFVQVARGGHLEEDGIVVLDDSREPQILHSQGGYKLSTELTVSGTVPQFGGKHLCSLKFKVWVIEKWLSENVYGSVRHGFGYHMDEHGRIRESDAAFASRATPVGFGFNVDELSRVVEARHCDSDLRVGFYPLMEWQWTRARCVEYILLKLGIVWRKSACVFCPFNNLRREGLSRHLQYPHQVAESLVLEHISLSMNPRATLYRDEALIDIMTETQNVEALAIFKEKISSGPWALYRVRRIYIAKGKADRCVEKCRVGTRQEMVALLDLQIRESSYIKRARGITYVYSRQREDNVYPSGEDFMVAAPARVESKARYGVPRFEDRWNIIIEQRQSCASLFDAIEDTELIASGEGS